MPPDTPNPNSATSGADDDAPAPSLREIAEAAYDEGSTTESETPSSEGVVRDQRGRFAPKSQEARTTGEAEPPAPSPEAPKPEAPVPPDPAAAARSSQASPDHWSAEDRAVFERLPPDAKAMLQRRYSEMEADYTRKSQANAGAVQAVNALAPIFNDPEIAASLKEANTHPIAAIQEWASMHKRGISPRMEERAGLLIDLATRLGFDPAKLFAPNRQPEPALPAGVQQDPAVRYFADQYGKTASEMQALRNEINAIHQAEAKQREDETLKVTRWSIDTFADEKGPNGQPLRPDFDEQLPYILELFKANPERDLNEAYDLARRMNPKTWESMVAAQKAQVQTQQSAEKARAANRGNVRGLTGPVSKPNGAKTGNGSLRDILDASAEEVGFR